MITLKTFEGFSFVEGGVCAAAGFSANGVHCGLSHKPLTAEEQGTAPAPSVSGKKDLAMISADCLCSAAAVYTTNLVKGAPLLVTREHLKNGRAQAVIVNSVNANTCNADGVEKANRMCALAAQALQIPEEDVIVASTGVIGQPLPIEPIEAAMETLRAGLRPDGNTDAVEAIMTTDTHSKEVAVRFRLDGTVCTLGGMLKGSGMIHPNMATTLTFLTTDAAISPAMLQQALSDIVQVTLNRVSVDGDTSTNDMVCVLASGKCGNPEITRETAAYETFRNALYAVLMNLARMMARDGEGATKLIECICTGADSDQTAETVAKSVITSSLFKAAMFGADANWGRILCAVGYSGAALDVSDIDVDFASEALVLPVCRKGAGVDFSEELAKTLLSEEEICVRISVGSGGGTAVAWGCDLTYDYVKINGDYRS